MNKSFNVQTLLSFAVILLVIFITFFLVKNYGFLKKEKCYIVFANFNDASGLAVGSHVKISGVAVGRVTNIEYKILTGKVEVAMCIKDSIKIAQDSVALISSSSLLAEIKYINLDLGNEEVDVLPGGYIINTQDPLNLEYFLRMLIMKLAQKDF